MIQKQHGSVSLLQEAIFRSYVDVVNARRKFNGVDNAFMQEVKSLHSNVSFQDLPHEFRGSLYSAAFAMLSYFASQGFKLVPID
jgi:hypothetical protein